MKILILVALVALFLLGCAKKKAIADLLDPLPSKARRPDGDGFTPYTIRKGEFYCDQNFPDRVKGTEMAFTVRFDASCIYTLPEADQADINKLWGFSEGSSNHYNSARFGWRWYGGELQLVPYVYIAGELYRPPSWELPYYVIPVGADVVCSIKVAYDHYLFSVDGSHFRLPRGPRTSGFVGYQLYPYFGGNHPAPHKVTIFIK